MSKAIGIDLGTTRSVAAVLEAGKPVLIPNPAGSCSTPSVVSFASDGQVVIGEAAERQAITNPDRTLRSTKRHLGTNWSTGIDGAVYVSQEVAARVLIELKHDAEAYLGEPVHQALIAVPASFNSAQRTAVEEAGMIAGLEVLRIISEPVLAALAVGVEFAEFHDPGQTVLVVDLGGGSLSVAVVEIGDGVFVVKAVDGDLELGGGDWDHCIVEWMIAMFKGTHGIDLSEDFTAIERLREAAEKAKIKLSDAHQAEIRLPSIAVSESGPLHLDEILTRAKFHELTFNLLERCKHPVEQVVKDSGLSMSNLDQVLMIGGSTRMPAVEELLRTTTGKVPHEASFLEGAVAKGAAIQAAVLKGSAKDILLLDVTGHSLGIETKGGVMTKLIERNATLPHRTTKSFLLSDFHGASEVVVLEGDRAFARYNQTLAAVPLARLPTNLDDETSVGVTFDLDANGILNVAVNVGAEGVSQSVNATSQVCLSGDELHRMRAKAIAQTGQQRRVEAHSIKGTPSLGEATSFGIILGLLPALDVCELAMARGEHDQESTFNDLLGVVERHGGSRINEAGVPFDPTIHEAVDYTPGQHGEQEIVAEILRPGYKCGDRLVRGALVRVSG